jgi:hypothetical protein
MTKQTNYLASVAILALAAVSTTSARAAYVMTFEETRPIHP